MNDRPNSIDQLAGSLGTILVSWPLYRMFVYYGEQGHEVNSNYTNVRYGVLPPRLQMFCNNEYCKQETWWQTDDTIFRFDRFISSVEYKCRNCGKSGVTYFFIWRNEDSRNVFLKIGQYPELEERIPESLVKALDQADLKLYKNAIRMRNFNLGIAAVAYLRRIVENKMADMLEILHETALSHNASAEVLKLHEEMKKEKRFATKIEYAGDLLPASLRPAGKPNPMAILHELASDGIHAKSDEECVDIFDRCRAIFEYVFGKMKIEVEEAKKFVASMANLTQERVKVVTAQPAVKKT